MSKNKKEAMTKTKHSSLDLPELEQPSSPKKPEKKISENAIWSKLTIFSESFKPKNNNNQTNDVGHKKSKTQTTLDYFLKSKPKDIKEKRQTISHPPRGLENGRPTSLQKQLSIGSYPVLLNIPEESAITRDRPATVCGANPGAEHKNTVAFNLDRPRKKLSFREPEITGYSKLSTDILPRKNIKAPFTPQMMRSISYNNEHIQRSASYEDLDLEVRCKKMSQFVGIACTKLM